MKSSIKFLLFLAMAAWIVLTAFVFYYNANPYTFWVIDTEQLLSDDELARIQQNLQADFTTPINTRRMDALNIEAAFDQTQNGYDVEKILENGLVEAPEYNNHYIFLTNKDLFRDPTGPRYFYYTDKNARITMIATELLAEETAEKSKRPDRVHKLILRAIGRLYGLPSGDGCGIMQDYKGLTNLDKLETRYCKDDVEWLREIKILRRGYKPLK